MRPTVAIRSVSLATLPLLVAGLTTGVFPEATSATASASVVASNGAALKAVAMTSTRNAWAVGCTGCLTTGSRAMIMRWNGAAWKRVPIGGSPGSVLAGVAATSPRNAWAVGSSNDQTLILRWNGTTWKPFPGSAARTGGRLDAVTASSARNAWAVGSTTSGRGLTLHWNGSTWKRVPNHSPVGSSFLAVTATSGRNAWAVGGAFVQADNGDKTLVEHWNGKVWKRQHSPTPIGNGSGLSGVVATSAHNAWAVGCGSCGIGGFSSSLIEHWNGEAWRTVSSPSPAGGGILAGVAATSPRHIVAVGSYYATSGESQSLKTLVLRWNGTTWQRLSSPNRGPEGGLFGVAAVSARRAWAVGSYQTKAGSSASSKSLILRGTGSSWSRSSRAASVRQGSNGQVAALTCLRRRAVRPANQVVTCANATTSWTHVKWLRWGASSATGRGDLFMNGCAPSCAKGRFASYPAKITLSKPRSTAKYGRLYARATVSYSLKGKHRTARFGLLGPARTGPHRVPLQTSTGGEFFSPLPKAGLNCEIDAGGAVPGETFCETFQPAESATMTPKGAITKCHPHGVDGCLGDPGEDTPTLGYGKWSGAGPFRCLSSRSGMLCTVSRGSGFLISASRITRIRGY